MPLRRTRSRRPFRSSTNRDISRGRRAQPDLPRNTQKRGGTVQRFRPVFLSFCKEVVPEITPERLQVKRTSESTRDPGIATPRQASQAKRGNMPADAVRKTSVRASPTKGLPRNTRMSTRCSGSGDRSRSVTPHAPQHNTKRAESLAGFRSLTVARSAGIQYCSFSLGKSPDFTSSM